MKYLQLHLNILLFSFTGIFSKLAALTLNEYGMRDIRLWGYFALMLINCMLYAYFWQKNLKHFNISIAYAHRSVYNLWSLLWAVLVFSERLSPGNIVGVSLILGGVIIQSE